ncbi:MAG: hypothetical protein RL062_1132, partial [Bacteroidota bacterium]
MNSSAAVEHIVSWLKHYAETNFQKGFVV